MQYYIFETYAPSGTNPPHAVTAVTARVQHVPTSVFCLFRHMLNQA